MKKIIVIFLLIMLIGSFASSQEATEENLCWDSDGGNDIYTYGIAEGTNAIEKDTCGAKQESGGVSYVTKCEGTSCGMIEAICNPSGTSTTLGFQTCPDGCVSGTCIKKVQDEEPVSECADVYEPVCGTDGKTYSNSCYAEKEDVAIVCKGECPCDSKTAPSGHFAVDDTAPVSDVVLISSVIQSLTQEGYSVPSDKSKLFSEVDALNLNNKVTLAIYNGEAIIIVGVNSPPDHVIFSGLLTRILEGKHVKTKTILSYEVKSSDLRYLFVQEECPIEEVICEKGSTIETYIGEDGCEHKRCVKPVTECRVGCICDSQGNVIKCEDISNVHLNQKFELRQGQSAKVVDYKDIKIKYVADSTCECPACPENAMCKPCACSEGILLQVERPQDCEAVTEPNRGCAIEGTEFSINVGEAKQAFGAEIKLMNYYSGVATLLVTREKIPPQGIYVRLNEKFSLSEGSAAKVTDYSYMKIILHGLSDGVAKVTVDMPLQCEGTEACTGTATDFSLKEGESREVFGVKLTFLDTLVNIGTGEEYATFVFEKSTSEGGVDIEIVSGQQTISYGEKASYKVVVTDKHPPIVCITGEGCISEPLVYRININNLPFSKDYPEEIKVPRGGSESFELVVKPYEVVEAEEKQARTITGKIVGSVVSEMVVSKPVKQVQISKKEAIEERATVSMVEERIETSAEIKEEMVTIGSPSNMIKRYKFSVTAILSDNHQIRDTAASVLEIKPKSPPKPPEFPGEKISIKLHKGWNLISLPGKLIRFDKEGIVKNQKLVGFVYIKEEQKYFSLQEAENVLGGKLNEYLAKNAFWIYSRNSVTLNIWVDREISYGDLSLVKGWNIVPITEDMLGGYLADILGDCDLEKIHLWDPKSQSWDRIDLGYSFSDYQAGYGFLIKSMDYCKLAGSEMIAPPPMPE